jgi:hypothetical protein
VHAGAERDASIFERSVGEAGDMSKAQPLYDLGHIRETGRRSISGLCTTNP